MPVDVRMPESANLIKWLKAEGDEISAGDELFQIETDKAVVDVAAEAGGRLRKILIPEGSEQVPADEVVALIALPAENDFPGQDDGGFDSAGEAGAVPEEAVHQEARRPEAGKQENAVHAGADGHDAAAGHGRIFVSPLARRLAREAGLDLADVPGSGPGRRIVARDVQAVLAAGEPGAAGPDAQARPDRPAAAPPPKRLPVDGMRRAIAQRVLRSKQEVPHFYLSCDVELDALMALRRQANTDPFGGAREQGLSVNDFIIKAMALALQRVPEANVAWGGDHILQYAQSDVGVAIAVEGGLYTPVIRNAESKSLQAISAEVRELVERARRRDIKAADSEGGTTSVSNLGMFGTKSFSAIINPPQATILAVGAGEERAVPKNGQVAIVNAMTVTLSCDHRVVDGALGSRLLTAFRQLLEHPVSLLL